MPQPSSAQTFCGTSCSALISLLHVHHPAQHHWWLADGGFPQRIAGLLAAPLQASRRRPRTLDELLQVFAPLPLLGAAEASPACDQARYRYLIRLRHREAGVCCWRRYPEGIGWQRRCGPMPLELFVQRFNST
jgi:hypothetical protein